ncbi:MAG: cytochrome c [Betaproteobacteria bacterium]|nr:cytochrome c [Betaproteobacteria bacterium]
MKTKALLLTLALTAAAPAWAGNVALGKTKSEQLACASCHGADGVQTTAPNFPRLAGQYEDYLVRALSDYKRGARKNAIMGGIASGLSKDDIENLAAYYASLSGALAVKR